MIARLTNAVVVLYFQQADRRIQGGIGVYEGLIHGVSLVGNLTFQCFGTRLYSLPWL
jgi:hypothetical protein